MFISASATCWLPVDTLGVGGCRQIVKHEIAGRCAAHAFLEVAETVFFFLFGLFDFLGRVMLVKGLSAGLSLQKIVYLNLFGLSEARHLRKFPPRRAIGQRPSFHRNSLFSVKIKRFSFIYFTICPFHFFGSWFFSILKP